MVMLPGGSAGGNANVVIVWDENPSNWTYVTAPTWTITNQSSTLACVQPVTITVDPPGDIVTLVGAATGPGACTTTSPCGPYASASPTVTCAPSTIAGVGPVFVETSVLKLGQVVLGCIRPVKLLVDLNGDGKPDVVLSHLVAFDPACGA
jgi:hypothetical protein